MKSAREQLDILSAYNELGSFRAAAVSRVKNVGRFWARIGWVVRFREAAADRVVAVGHDGVIATRLPEAERADQPRSERIRLR